MRPADLAPLATINQIAPIYVSFTVPQRMLADLREAMAKGGSGVDRDHSRRASAARPARSR